jgi:phosphomevalonate kinase
MTTLVARAPGKVVASGAYAVLLGAPALVLAVDRYAVARDDKEPTFESEEVRAALALLEEEGVVKAGLTHPFVDATELRDSAGNGSRKLGLGSSAAIVVASLAVILARHRGEPASLEEIRTRALVAHRKAQGGGSGVDVDAATYGGCRVFQLARTLDLGGPASKDPKPDAPEPRSYGVDLPEGLTLEVWAVPRPASTQKFVAEVWGLRQRDAKAFEHLLGAQCLASLEAERALHDGSATDLIAALRGQSHVLEELGNQANIPIFLADLLPLRDELPADAAFLPAGAGGGDIMLFAGRSRSPSRFREAAEKLGLAELDLQLCARGVHFV